MILGHVLGLPLEESVIQVAPAGAAIVTAAAIGGRAALAGLRRRLSHRLSVPQSSSTRGGTRDAH